MDSFPDRRAPIAKRTLLTWWVGAILLILLALGLVLLPRIWAELQYPLAYEEIIKQEAADHDLDPFLVAAVIKSESGFSPRAVSPVGARGLMQIMPLTAQGIAKRMGDTAFTLDKLFEPGTSIRYGTFHLQGLMGRYDSNVEAALVGYNGGGGAGDRYLAGERSSVPGESLRYVEKVLAAKVKYEELYPVRLGSDKSLSDFFKGQTTGETLANRLLKAVQGAVTEKLTQ